MATNCGRRSDAGRISPAMSKDGVPVRVPHFTGIAPRFTGMQRSGRNVDLEQGTSNNRGFFNPCVWAASWIVRCFFC
jgi:hypothetical protein